MTNKILTRLENMTADRRMAFFRTLVPLTHDVTLERTPTFMYLFLTSVRNYKDETIDNRIDEFNRKAK